MSRVECYAPSAPRVSQNSTRLEYLDYLRGILMTLGIVTHSAFIYTVDGSWKISDPHAQSVVFDGIIHFLQLFRLPSFFILSGLLTAVSASRTPLHTICRKRITRIGIPLITTLFLVNTLEVQICQTFFTSNSSSGWGRGWIGHLWFLVYLIGYHAALTLIVGSDERLARFRSFVSDSFPKYLLFLPIIGGCYEIALRVLVKIIPMNHVELSGLNLFDWLVYLPFYAAGFIIGTNRALIAEFSNVRPLHVVTGLVSGLGLYFNPFSGAPGVVTDRFCHITLVWVCCIVCFAVFEHLCKQTSGLIRFIAEASYTVYLLHHIIVIILGLLIMPADWPVFAKFGFVMIGAAVLTFGFHRVVVMHVPVVALLLNGVPLDAKPKQRTKRVLPEMPAESPQERSAVTI
jgi:glucans biosynthesis protein C